MTITCKACGQSTEVKMAQGAVRYGEQIMRLHKLYACAPVGCGHDADMHFNDGCYEPGCYCPGCDNTSGRRNNASAQSKGTNGGVS